VFFCNYLTRYTYLPSGATKNAIRMIHPHDPSA
jgi:hypothetical protein